ncbi:MAG: repeat-containing protein, partial [Bacteroidetes bacterium]|nr:repeat-containing protein [Bacteroidota bacterium]
RRPPSPVLPSRLDPLFQHLVATHIPREATETEDRIWELWMTHPNAAATRVLDRAASDIAAQRFDIAETRLAALLRSRPDFPEAWNKRATLYYMLGRDDACIGDVRRTLQLEPRHFGAICGFAEICLARGEREAALFAFRMALRINPHLAQVATTVAALNSGEDPTAH